MNQNMKPPKCELFKDETKVLLHQAKQAEQIEKSLTDIISTTENAIKETEKLLAKLGVSTPDKVFVAKQDLKSSKQPKLRSWEELMSETTYLDEKNIDIHDLLSEEEIEHALNSVESLRDDFKALHKLDKVDWSIVGVAGTLAALTDVFLVQMPKHPGFLGGESNEGGKLSNYIRDKLQGSLSPQEISKLERENWVPYDASHSKYLSKVVEGLGPRTHRFQSLGHDPILGFLFGTRDILTERMTAFDKNGILIFQDIASKDRDIIGMNIFEAIGRVFGHLKSDVATNAGLPAPLMPILQFLQVGKFGKNNYTIGEVSRIMYRSGYDFSHFLSMSVPTLIIEVIVRISYLVKNLMEGKSLKDSIPFDTPNNRKPKLQTMLFSAHVIATVSNAGKVYFTKNPLAINYPQWMLFARYSFSQVKWVSYVKEAQMHSHVQKQIDKDWDAIHANLDKTVTKIFDEKITF